MLQKHDHVIFSDGSALGNPGPGGYGTVIILNKTRIVELGEREKHTTNNRMEIMGMLVGLRRIANERGTVLCCSDSQYVINAVTKWIHGWKKNGWITSTKQKVEHRELFEEIDAIVHSRKRGDTISFQYVAGHVGVAGNERCDEIATTFARGETPNLFEGALVDYAVDILNIAHNEDQAKSRASSKKRSGKAYSYLSLVDGVIKKHTTWEECEKRVKGKSGVKYKKALSKEEERDIELLWRK